jgi:hypothetical protein
MLGLSESAVGVECSQMRAVEWIDERGETRWAWFGHTDACNLHLVLVGTRVRNRQVLPIEAGFGASKVSVVECPGVSCLSSSSEIGSPWEGMSR